jgi:hypothetical protein
MPYVQAMMEEDDALEDQAEVNKILQPMDEEQVGDIVQTLITQATAFIDSQISPIRINVDKYYQGETGLPFEKGRSSIIITKVRDTVKSVIPSVARIFTQSEPVAEFSSEDEEDEQICQDQTLFVNNVYQKYGGYKALIIGSTDALKARVGVTKVWLEQKELPAHRTVSVADQEGLDMLQEDGSTIASQSPPDENGNVAVVLSKKSIRKIWHLDPIPPESFFIDSTATCIDDCRVVGTRVNMTVYEAHRIGLDLEDLLEIAGSGGDASDQMTSERQERTPYNIQDFDLDYTSLPNDPMSATLLICEVWYWLDADGDGVAELHHAFTGGSNFELIHDEVCDFVPLAIYLADLQPHVFFPICLGEDMMADQDASTALMRSILDNTALVNSPRTEVNENYVNLEDVKNNEIGAIVRVTQSGGITELTTPFVAGQTLPVLQYLDSVSEQRSGVTKLSQGLSPDALQSTTRVASNAAVQGADARLEMMARNLGETGIKGLFLAILRTAMYELKGPQSVKTTTGYREVRPDFWHDQVNVSVNVGLGNGRMEEKSMALGMIAQVQQAIVQQLGPANPLSGWNNLRNTYKTILQMSGIKNVQEYFPIVPTEALQALDKQQKEAAAAASKGPQAPDLVGAAKVKAESDIQVNQAKIMSQQQSDMAKLQAEQSKLIATMQQQHQLDMTAMRAEMSTKLTIAGWSDDQKRDAANQQFAVDSKKVELDNQTKLAVSRENASNQVTQ